jgi:hypothetical protein
MFWCEYILSFIRTAIVTCHVLNEQTVSALAQFLMSMGGVNREWTIDQCLLRQSLCWELLCICLNVLTYYLFYLSRCPGSLQGTNLDIWAGWSWCRVRCWVLSLVPVSCLPFHGGGGVISDKFSVLSHTAKVPRNLLVATFTETSHVFLPPWSDSIYMHE